MGFVHLFVIPIYALCIWLIAFSLQYIHSPFTCTPLRTDLTYFFPRVIRFSLHFYAFAAWKTIKLITILQRNKQALTLGKTQWSLSENNAEQGRKELNQSKLREWQVGEWPAEPKHTLPVLPWCAALTVLGAQQRNKQHHVSCMSSVLSDLPPGPVSQ